LNYCRLPRWIAKSVFAIWIMLLISSYPAVGSEATVEAYQSGDYAESRQIWSNWAEAGDYIAIFNLGLLYYQGLGVPVEMDRAAKFFYQSAIQGYAPAQYMYGRYHESGQTADSSPASARFWTSIAARQGHANASFRYGKYLVEGYGGAKDTQLGLRWLRTAEKLQVTAANRYLSEFESRLPGVITEDEGKLTAKLTEGRGTLKQRKEFYQGQKAFITQDYQTAVSTWVPLAEQGMAKAQYGVAFMLESGWGVVQDYSEAAYWYKLSAQKGHRKAQFNLGKQYLEGRGVKGNEGIGLYWIQSAADLGEVRAIKFIRELQ
jgi:TPR repeat protein